MKFQVPSSKFQVKSNGPVQRPTILSEFGTWNLFSLNL
jgi:hypothetical protein